MRKQLDLFGPPEPDADDRLNAAQAEMRLAEMERQRSRATDRARSRHHRSVSARCPTCGSCVTIRVS